MPGKTYGKKPPEIAANDFYGANACRQFMHVASKNRLFDMARISDPGAMVEAMRTIL